MWRRFSHLPGAGQAPRAVGPGKPEPLKHQLSGLWSRRLSLKDRLIYRFDDVGLWFLRVGLGRTRVGLWFLRVGLERTRVGLRFLRVDSERMRVGPWLLRVSYERMRV